MASFVSAILVTAFGVEVEPEVVLGFAGVAASFIGIEGWADKADRAAAGAYVTQVQQAWMSQLQSQIEDLQEQVFGPEDGPSEIGMLPSVGGITDFGPEPEVPENG